MNITENIILAPYTVFNIGGPADFFCEVKNKEELVEVLDWARDNKTPFFIMGAGSNLLVSDDGFRGLAIKMSSQNIDLLGENKIFVAAGVSMARAVNFSIEKGFGGFEWGVGIPGTVGGAVFGNAGCFGGEMKDAVDSVSILERKIFELPNDACEFAYRHSVFKRHPEWIILGATLNFFPGDKEKSRAKVLEYTKKRTASQDIGEKCAGCIFKNPKQDLAAGYLIDKVGLKGAKIGGAMVSGKHANYIVNTGGATARDVKELIMVIKDEVKKVNGILMEEEIRII